MPSVTFQESLAVKYGVEEAIILNTFYFWIRKNEANQRHFYEDTYWTYNTTEALAKLFPYWSKHKIGRILKRMIDKKLIRVGNFNQTPMNRTLWYSLTKDTILQFRKIEFADSPNGNSETAKCYNSIYTSRKTNQTPKPPRGGRRQKKAGPGQV